ncbi:chaperone modulator CbpM [Ottowia sp.]|jgi:chaperone modulatory protein CbpM|uniref:chaperone modulator CbpM n=1 Tax=Ottowia sp. TaxID=1898956 RepID=UPI0025CC0057|nr:chaperone modulator CbpM [Ottowia sp.]MBK6614695.1 MerR family transcriptional regulator [Ottowia sp.]MBK6745781.1 MerR family transcriptional regulator [Ottowia sp.]
MAPTPITIPAELVELLDDDALSLHELARGSRVTTEWVLTHVEAGVLQPQRGQAATEWRFTGAALVRARRIAQLEHIYDADPQLAALATDLMEEVARLRRRLQEI